MAKFTTPHTDGIDHINIYSKGVTELGRFLSNFARTPFVISIGKFESIEGLIYFLGSFDERLRSLHGYEAKKIGRESDQGIRLPEAIFERLIKEAMTQKLRNFPRMAKTFAECKLPLSHYYVVNGAPKAVLGWSWQIDEWERLREELAKSPFRKD